MQIEKLFKEETGFEIKETRYLKPPKLPYFLFTNKKNYKGADLIINLVENNITIERYSETNNDKDLEDCSRVKDFLDRNHYEYDIDGPEWLSDEKLYATFWILNPILEKIRKEDNYYERKKN